MTRSQLRAFIRRRNASPHASNLQFQIDARASGFSVDELDQATLIEGGYEWTTPHGSLREVRGKMSLHPARKEVTPTD